MSSLTERLRAMLAEAGSERQTLESQRTELAAERDAKINAIRTEYASRIEAIDADLAVAKRVERALEPPEERAKYAHRPAASEATPKPAGRPERVLKWRPNAETTRAVLAAVADDRTLVSEISEVVEGVSRATIDNAVNALRADGLLRLAGTAKREGSSVAGRSYRLTAAGTDYLNANRTENGAHA
jgi:DNA-binding transcriptional ArsR family regulator